MSQVVIAKSDRPRLRGLLLWGLVLLLSWELRGCGGKLFSDHVGDLGADFLGVEAGCGFFRWNCGGDNGGSRGGNCDCRIGALSWIRILGFGPFHPFGFFLFLFAGGFQGSDGAVGVGLFFLFFFFFEIFVVPDVGAQRSVGGVARVEDDVMAERCEGGHAQVGAGGLQGVEQEAGGFVVDLLRDEQAYDLHESDLDGVGVFEDGEDESGYAAAGAVGAELDLFVLKTFVEETETVAAQGGRSALGAVDFEMLAAIGKTLHWSTPPPPLVIYWNHRVSGKLRFNP